MKSVITCDLEGLIETINPDGEKLFGYTKEELVADVGTPLNYGAVKDRPVVSP